MHQHVPEKTDWKAIEVAKLPVGTIIYLECLEAGAYHETLYELTVTHDGYRIVTVNTTHPLIDDGAYAELKSEIIEKHTLMMRFQRSVHSTGDVMHVRVKGPDWHYDVF